MAESLRESVPHAVVYMRAWQKPPALGVPVFHVGEGESSYPEGVNLCAQWAAKDGYQWLFMGSDDIVFHPRWYERALEAASDRFDVVGTNDLGNPRVRAGLHSTHSLVRASYLQRGTIDTPGLMWEGYAHNFADDEFVETAKIRGRFVHATDSIVEHFHPAWEKAEVDNTYALFAMNQDLFQKDRQKFLIRQQMWKGPSGDQAHGGLARASLAR